MAISASCQPSFSCPDHLLAGHDETSNYRRTLAKRLQGRIGRYNGCRHKATPLMGGYFVYGGHLPHPNCTSIPTNPLSYGHPSIFIPLMVAVIEDSPSNLIMVRRRSPGLAFDHNLQYQRCHQLTNILIRPQAVANPHEEGCGVD